jgi:hypothetical protein
VKSTEPVHHYLARALLEDERGQVMADVPRFTFRHRVIPLLADPSPVGLGRIVGTDQPTKTFAIRVPDGLTIDKIATVDADLKMTVEHRDDREAVVQVAGISPRPADRGAEIIVRAQVAADGSVLTARRQIWWHRVPEVEWVIASREHTATDATHRGELDLFSNRSEPFTIETVKTTQPGDLIWSLDGSRLFYAWTPGIATGTATIEVVCRSPRGLQTVAPATLTIAPEVRP